MGKVVSNTNLATLVADLKEDEALTLARQMIDAEEDPLRILEQCQNGLFEVGKRYEKRIYFISALIMGGEIMDQVSNLIQPFLSERHSGDEKGVILLGTVEGDIHYIGKDLFKLLARCHGFTVKDIGVDVPAQDFLDTYVNLEPDIVGMSCLLQVGYDKLKETVAKIKSNISPSEKDPAFIIGGIVDKTICEYVKADFFTNDAMEGVRICQNIVKNI
jgi:methanogenic corrinoid protein MtbC1